MTTDEAREAAVLRWSTTPGEVFDAGVAEGILRAREAVENALDDRWWDDGTEGGSYVASGIRVAGAAIEDLTT